MIDTLLGHLHVKVGVAVTGVVVAVMATIVAVNVGTQERNLAQNAETSARYLIEATLAGIKRPMERGDNDLVEAQLLANGRATPGMRADICDSALKVIFSTSERRVGTHLDASIESPTLLVALRGSIGTGDQPARAFNDVSDGQHRLVTFRAIPNAPECRRCHEAENAVIGALVVSQDLDDLQSQNAELRTVSFSTAAAGTLAIIALLYLLITRMVLDPIRELNRGAEILAGGDLTYEPRLRPPSLLVRALVSLSLRGASASKPPEDEIRHLAGSFRRMAARQRGVILRIKDLVVGVTRLSERLSEATGSVSDGAATIGGRVADCANAMAMTMESVRNMSASVDVLHVAADQSSSSLKEIAVGNASVVENVSIMSKTVEETARATASMSTSVQETSRNIEGLNAFVTETSAAMTAMDASFQSVKRNTEETASIFRAVSADAERHAAAVRRTLDSIAKIREASRAGAQVYAELGTHIEAISDVVKVITEITGRTNLLALNASIVSAEAGDSGRAFAVIAGEIKVLAERTSTSAQEIKDLVERVQRLSESATASIDASVRSVAEGMRASEETESGLNGIVQSAKRSALMVDAIASSTVDQARSSREVEQAVRSIAETVIELTNVTRELARGAGAISGNTDKVRHLTVEVACATAEQSQGSRQVAEATQRVLDMAGTLRETQRTQAEGSHNVLSAVEAISGVSRAQGEAVSDLKTAVATLSGEISELSVEIDRFRLS
jgi:methyl-accepting chemotaxis protein